MNQLVAQAIILNRTNFGEADRIITLLTPDSGKLRLIAKGVRKPKSRLAGGIELFSVSDITYVRGRSELGTLTGARLDTHYSSIVLDVKRTMLGYELIKQLNKVTEDQPEPEYFKLLEQAFAALNDPTIALPLIITWFNVGLIQQAGYAPNLHIDAGGSRLAENKRYNFSFDDMAFISSPEGRLDANHIKFLRLAFSGNSPKILSRISAETNLLSEVLPLTRTLVINHVQR